MADTNARAAAADDDEVAEPDQLSMRMLRGYIAYCRSTCGPRMQIEATAKLKNKFVTMRSEVADKERNAGGKGSAIPITVRQLEAIVRISEALAKMELKSYVGEAHVDEALRLFQVSTLNAAMSGCLSGVDEFTTSADSETIARVEAQLKRRFTVGSQVSEYSVMQDFAKQKYSEHDVRRVISCMIRRGELQYRMQRRLLYRVK